VKTLTVRGLGLLAALAALTVASGPAVVAQDTKKKKEEPKSSTTKGVVKIGESKDGKWRFSIYDGNEKYLGQSAAFASKEDAMKGMEALRAALASPKIEDKPKDEADEKTPPKKEKEKAKAKDKDKDSQ
jgi:uncharacterized protein YegP (UPF0339 family)